MNNRIEDILTRGNYSRGDILTLLRAEGKEKALLFNSAYEMMKTYSGNHVWFRGLIEFSNTCRKNCLYCGIRRGNTKLERYNISDDEILAATEFAYRNNWGSVALQSGEVESAAFSERIERLVKEIKKLSGGELGITLSLGEQEPEVYRRWFDAGAHRYLLRIETSNPLLYGKIHPNDDIHDYNRRLNCIRSLQEIGYMTGTGVMTGLPFQTLEDLADDLLFMKNLDIDMCGMGPYIEHADTPLIHYKDELLPTEKRFDLTLKMIAILRLMMKDINIVASTALQAIDPIGREKAIRTGANIIMPNITPGKYRDSYLLYANKPCTADSAEDCQSCLEARVKLAGAELVYGKWGDSPHYLNRIGRLIKTKENR